ncbi:MAG: InlB B-repeat-containing protein [Bifidobacteriaceae bacterium]|jgi:transposase-like protein|nr:InlB B-repeat-containing protein [Bifidobacteriaceae bacterium]
MNKHVGGATVNWLFVGLLGIIMGVMCSFCATGAWASDVDAPYLTEVTVKQRNEQGKLDFTLKGVHHDSYAIKVTNKFGKVFYEGVVNKDAKTFSVKNLHPSTYTVTVSAVEGAKKDTNVSKIDVQIKPKNADYANKFTDLQRVSPARTSSIRWLYKYGITVGMLKDGNTYNPHDAVNRGAMAEFMHKIVGYVGSNKHAVSVNDIDNLWSARKNSIKWLAQEGITVLTGDGKYNPQNTVNRGAMAEFIYKLAGSPGALDKNISSAKHHVDPNTVTNEADRFKEDKELTAFKTSNPNRYYAVLWLAKHKITVGSNPEGTLYSPHNVVNRGAMAEFMQKLYENVLFANADKSGTDSSEYFAYIVSFETNGGSDVKSIVVPENDKITSLVTTTKPAHDFVDWYTDASLTGVYSLGTPVTHDIKLYAGWKDAVPVVVYSANGGTGTEPIPAQHAIPQGIDWQPPKFQATKGNDVFVGWNTEPDGSGIDVLSGVTGKHDLGSVKNGKVTLYAQYAPAGLDVLGYMDDYRSSLGIGGTDRSAVTDIVFSIKKPVTCSAPYEGSPVDISASKNGDIVACVSSDKAKILVGENGGVRAGHSVTSMFADMTQAPDIRGFDTNTTNWENVIEMGGMFNGFGSKSAVAKITTPKFPKDFGRNATSMSYMFAEFGKASKNATEIVIQDFPEGFGSNAEYTYNAFDNFAAYAEMVESVTLPKFPKGFGSKATVMPWMFRSIGAHSPRAKSITLPEFPAGFGKNGTVMYSLFESFGEGADSVEKLSVPDFPAGFGYNATEINGLFMRFGAFTSNLKSLTMPKLPDGCGRTAYSVGALYTSLAEKSVMLKELIIPDYPQSFGAKGRFVGDMFEKFAKDAVNLESLRFPKLPDTFGSEADSVRHMFSEFAVGAPKLYPINLPPLPNGFGSKAHDLQELLDDINAIKKLGN